MNRRALPLMMGLLLLPLGCGGDDPTGPSLVLQPSDLCSENSDDAIATFEDARLEVAIRDALGIFGAQENLTRGLISRLGFLQALGSFSGTDPITSLVGIQNLRSLTTLDLGFNSITEISALSGLTSLTGLILIGNSITDISALSELTSLTTLILVVNSITDISALSGLTSLTGLILIGGNPDLSNIKPLLDNTGLGAGDTVDLRATNVSCPDVAALEAKGVTVESDCP